VRRAGTWWAAAGLLALAAGCETRKPTGGGGTGEAPPPAAVGKAATPGRTDVSLTVAGTDDVYTASLKRAVKFALSAQNADGSFGPTQAPDALVGMTGLMVNALLGCPVGLTEANTQAIRAAVAFMLKHQDQTGRISAGGMGNYNTSAAVTALVATGNAAYRPALEKAEKYLRGVQIDEGEGLTKVSPFYGGVDYGKGTNISDLSNTGMWVEAMHALGMKPDDPAMKNAMLFVSRVTNNPEVNDQPWAKEASPESFGGAVYRPAPDPNRKDVDISKAGADRTGWRSYGSMTYHAFKSFIYGGRDAEDPGVQGALSWIELNYTVDENPGIGKQGQYYYYRVMSRALSALGRKEIAGRDWARDLADKLVSLQKEDGSWTNEADRWHEGDPSLVTAYCIEAMSLAVDAMKK
jgi:squalene-hopene/tetraprenyl-beta-curcumene cyclase